MVQIRLRLLRTKAIIWLHTLRLWRYKYSVVNMAVNTMLWLTIFLLGALMFVPSHKLGEASTIAFWALAMWQIMSNSVWLIGGWTNFMVGTGLVEEHLLYGVSLPGFFAGRVIPGLAVSILGILLVYLVFYSILGTTLALVTHAVFLVIGIVALTIMATCYGLILSAISIRIGVPETLLDIGNFLVFIMGGIATPVKTLPGILKKIALFIPYSHAAELLRYGAAGIQPYIDLWLETVLTIVITVSMIALALYVYSLTILHVKKTGIRAVGRM